MNGITTLPNTNADLDSSLPRLEQKISDASRQFESVLLGQWLQQAEASFGSVPGEQDDSDGSQMKNFAMQHLAEEITKSGGIGISKIIEAALTKSAAQPGKGINIPQSVASADAQRIISGKSDAR